MNIATLYRPSQFSDVVGQDLAVVTLKRIAKADGIVAKSIFLKGSYGSGKSTLARLLGKAMNCETFKKTGEVCNECPGCKEAMSKTSQTYLEYDTTAVGNVEDIKALIERLQFPAKGRRVVVLDECHAASKQALNALLKTIEEGIPNTVFVFASTEDILPTIKSRSVVVDINLIPTELIKKRVRIVMEDRNLEMSDEQLEVLAIKSKGHMRDALSTLQLFELCGDDALKSSYNTIREFIIACLSADKKEHAEELIYEIMRFNIVDINSSLSAYIKTLLKPQKDSLEEKIKTKGMSNKIFEYFYTPHAQQALRDEQGIELLLRAFLDKLTKR